MRLGCATKYAAVIHLRGGRRRAFQLTGLTAADWERKLDDFGEAGATLTKSRATTGCLNKVATLEPWQHELTLYRDGQRLWEGPVFDVEEAGDEITIKARDVTAWLWKRGLRTAPTAVAVNAAAHAQAIITDALQADGADPNLLPHLQVVTANSPSTQRETQILTTTAAEELREVAAAGLDYYAIGRAIHVRPDRVDYATRLPRLLSRHIRGNVKVRKVGSEAATRGLVVGSAAQGPAPIGQHGGASAVYGLIEQISQAQNTSDVGVLNAIAHKIVGYGNPVPLTVTVPSGSQLAPDAPITVDHLIPGRYLELWLSDYVIPVRAVMKLQQIGADWSADAAEKVNISLIPKDVFDVPDAA